MSINKKNILLTGASGFIGSKLIEKIKNYKNYKIITISRKKEKILNTFFNINSDISEIEKIKKKLIKIKKIDFLIHLAWDGIPDYDKKSQYKSYYDSLNFIIELNKLYNFHKIIIAGTCLEKTNIQRYRFLKLYKLKLYEQLKKNNVINIHWLRFFFVYGYFKHKKN